MGLLKLKLRVCNLRMPKRMKVEFRALKLVKLMTITISTKLNAYNYIALIIFIYL
jgi:hypothetical protein